MSNWGSKFVASGLMILGSILFALPFYVMVVMALKSPQQIATTTIWSFPSPATFDNFNTVLSNPNIIFSLLLKNTLIVAALTTFGTLVSSVIVAYAFARMKFIGRDRLFLIVLAMMMLPSIVTMIPTYVMYARLHWINTFLPMVVPSFFASAYNVFLLRQFFLGIPREMDEAAILDGASHWNILTRVILPNSGAALATVGIFAFIGSWRDFMGPLLYLNDPQKQTLEVGLRSYQAINGVQWHLIMAASVLTSIPLIVLFFVGQRYFVKGIVMTGGK